jgi:hypothetical protein
MFAMELLVCNYFLVEWFDLAGFVFLECIPVELAGDWLVLLEDGCFYRVLFRQRLLYLRANRFQLQPDDPPVP